MDSYASFLAKNIHEYTLEVASYLIESGIGFKTTENLEKLQKLKRSKVPLRMDQASNDTKEIYKSLWKDENMKKGLIGAKIHPSNH